jgi:drug/metabolite transporter (DMT)-like permease
MNQNLLYGIVLLSAVGHAVWNALLKNAADRLIMMVAIRIVGLLYGLIVLSVVEWPPTASLPWLLAAALAMWVYQGLLIQGYQAGDLSFVYPLARGIAPVLLTGLAFLSIGESITSQQLLGVISISLGIATLAFLGRGGWSSLVYAALTGASIASYSLLSGVGVRSSSNLLGFSAALEVTTGLGMLTYAASMRGGSILPSLLAIWATGLGAGAISVGGYLAFLVAVSYLPIGPVSAIRECSALFGVLIGVFVMKERFGVIRAIGAFLMTGGIVLLSLF